MGVQFSLSAPSLDGSHVDLFLLFCVSAASDTDSKNCTRVEWVSLEARNLCCKHLKVLDETCKADRAVYSGLDLTSRLKDRREFPGSSLVCKYGYNLWY